MPKFAAGLLKFQKDVYPDKAALFETLSHGQEPEVLFITCADSRIETSLITQTEPGDLFVCRNAGNIVPPHTDETEGMAASIEYAVSVLNVPHIVVCGHAGCGAMAGAMNTEGLDALPHVERWLVFSQEAVSKTKALAQGKTDAEAMSILIEQNVLLQLEHLKTHPTVAARLEAGDLQLHGWVYDIKTGGMTAYDTTQDKFILVDAEYVAQTEKNTAKMQSNLVS